MIGSVHLPERRETALVGLTLATTVAATVFALRVGPMPLLLLAAAAIGGVVAWRYPVILLYAYCAAIPFNFALPPGPAGTVARIAGIAFFAGYLVRRPASLKPNAIPLVGWIFLAWALASSLWALNAGLSFQSWLSLAQLFLITVLVAGIVAADPSIARTAFWCYAISASITAVSGSITYLQSPTLFLARAAAFTDQDPALWASALLPAMVFLMGEIGSAATDRRLRLVAVAGFVACAVALTLSGTRSAWVGGLVALGVWILVRRDPRHMLAVAAGACALALLVSAVPGMGDFLAERTGSSLTSGGAGRTSIWAVGAQILGQSPLAGVGWANFPVAFGPYAIAQSAVASAGGAVVAGRGPHNVLLGTAVETGLIGALLLVAFFAYALLAPRRGQLAVVVRIALLSLFVQGMFLDLLQQKQLWLLVGIGFGLAASAEAETAADRLAPIARGYRRLAPASRTRSYIAAIRRA